jgi:hypothetical protein
MLRQQRKEDFQKRCMVLMLCAIALATRIPEPTVRSPSMDWQARVSSLNDRRFKVRSMCHLLFFCWPPTPPFFWKCSDRSYM